jgi:hypothetical protein
MKKMISDHWPELFDAYDRRWPLPPMAPHLLEDSDRNRLVRHMRRALTRRRPVPVHILRQYTIPDGAAS